MAKASGSFYWSSGGEGSAGSASNPARVGKRSLRRVMNEPVTSLAAAGRDRGTNFAPAQPGMCFARRYLGQSPTVTNVCHVIFFLFAFINEVSVSWDLLPR